MPRKGVAESVGILGAGEEGRSGSSASVPLRSLKKSDVSDKVGEVAHNMPRLRRSDSEPRVDIKPNHIDPTQSSFLLSPARPRVSSPARGSAEVHALGGWVTYRPRNSVNSHPGENSAAALDYAAYHAELVRERRTNRAVAESSHGFLDAQCAGPAEQAYASMRRRVPGRSDNMHYYDEASAQRPQHTVRASYDPSRAGIRTDLEKEWRSSRVRVEGPTESADYVRDSRKRFCVSSHIINPRNPIVLGEDEYFEEAGAQGVRVYPELLHGCAEPQEVDLFR
eukprot:CAMPEP_0196659130 /NCGR_PEP_ID=MMETSP1086-20130531/33232_1 /TAXON_ID=77921 /ORGANISM="Cyanoptyche  gloeocystis , Strain SAG4.97" /LENGTH=280 /DNA_ID=CAMNT_0041992985 /DNA_START=146 /DNA_END=985 /DNA_ORIENTATION=-